MGDVATDGKRATEFGTGKGKAVTGINGLI
jgi:hypothetical protein